MIVPAIKVENLSKKYTIGTSRSGDLRESFNNFFQSFRPSGKKSNASQFWALKDLTFEVEKGEAVGIIGRNGAGKSTLLKILSRITEPTNGRYLLNGRVSSLLEVGTGFHPELTGRENVYLNGTILGMRRKEVRLKFDEIVAFSGVSKFIDTPVKHYSSGMKVRLAFAVAAHLEPEILIIDEVLAVGDAEFQKKCLGKMDEVSKNQGRTILFVSHNMGAVEALCSRGIILENGKIAYNGETEGAINHYLNNVKQNRLGEEQHVIDLISHPNKKAGLKFGMQKAEIFVNGKPSTVISSGDDLLIKIKYNLEKELISPVLGIVIKSPHNDSFIGVNNRHTAQKLSGNNLVGIIQISIRNFAIYGTGKCTVDLYFGDSGDDFDTILDAFYLDLKASDIFGSGVFVNPTINKVYQPLISFESAK